MPLSLLIQLLLPFLPPCKCFLQMWLVTVSSFLLLAWRTSGQQLWPKEVILVRKYPVDYPDEKPVPIQEPPLKRGKSKTDTKAPE